MFETLMRYFGISYSWYEVWAINIVANELDETKAVGQYSPVVILGSAKQSNYHDYKKPCLASNRGQKTPMSTINIL